MSARYRLTQSEVLKASETTWILEVIDGAQLIQRIGLLNCSPVVAGWIGKQLNQLARLEANQREPDEPTSNVLKPDTKVSGTKVSRKATIRARMVGKVASLESVPGVLHAKLNAVPATTWKD